MTTSPQQGSATLLDKGNIYGPCMGRWEDKEVSQSPPSCPIVEVKLIYETQYSPADNMYLTDGTIIVDPSATFTDLVLDVTLSHDVDAAQFDVHSKETSQ